MITRSQLNFLLSVKRMLETNQMDQRFGEIAIENRFVREPDIQRALLVQKKMIKEHKAVKRLGDILVDLGVMAIKQRDAILVKQNRVKEIGTQEGPNIGDEI